jgi:hypothetical protein
MEKLWTNAKLKKISSKDAIMSSQKTTKQTGKLKSNAVDEHGQCVFFLVGLLACSAYLFQV